MGQGITRHFAFTPPAPSYTASLPNVWISRHKGDPTQRIPALFIDPSTRGVPPRRTPVTLLYSHGNAEDLGQLQAELELISRVARVHVLAYDYPGYGLNTGEAPTESGVERDEALAFAYLVRERGVDPRSIVLMGRSIGSGPAVHLAAELCRQAHPELGCPQPGMLGGLVVQSGLASCARVVSAAAAYVPFTDMFCNVDKIGDVTVPVCIIHGKRDSVVPFAHGQQLWERTQKQCRWRFLELDEADHNDIPVVAHAQWITTLIDFADMVENTLCPQKSFFR